MAHIIPPEIQKITIENFSKAVILNYNDIPSLNLPIIFSKKRTIVKSSVEELRLSVSGEEIELIKTGGIKEVFNYEFFQGYTDNESLFEALSAMLCN
jgi:hypothetical protein